MAVAVVAEHGSRSQPGTARRSRSRPKATAWFVLSLAAPASSTRSSAPRLRASTIRLAIGSKSLRCRIGLLRYGENPAYLSRIRRADERTRTADLPSLRVRGQWLLSVAGVCKSRLGKGFSVPWLACNCRVLRAG